MDDELEQRIKNAIWIRGGMEDVRKYEQATTICVTCQGPIGLAAPCQQCGTNNAQIIIQEGLERLKKKREGLDS